MAYNKVILVGRLVAAPELRHTQDNTPVASCRMAVDRPGKDKGTDFLDIVAWSGTAEFAARHLTKGQEIMLEGRIQTRSYEDRNGNKRTAVEVVAASFYFVGSKRQDQGYGQDAGYGGGFTPIDDDDDYGDLPFA